MPQRSPTKELKIKNPLDQENVKGELPEGSGIRIDFDGDEFTFASYDPTHCAWRQRACRDAAGDED